MNRVTNRLAIARPAPIVAEMERRIAEIEAALRDLERQHGWRCDDA